MEQQKFEMKAKGTSLDTLNAMKEVVSKLSGKRKYVFISNLGYRSRELYSIADGPDKFYMLGSMGLASSIGLGLSLALKNREVAVFDGDASIIMNLGSLTSIANFAPRNYHIFILDNRSNASTGGQKSPTAMRTDLFELAKAAGIESVVRVNNANALSLVLRRKKLPTAIMVECTDSDFNVPVIPIPAFEIKKRFMNYLVQSR